MQLPDRRIENSLRLEIVESQKTQAEFLKWKLLGVAGIGSLALGMSDRTPVTNLDLLLCLIPLICAYVDLISVHIMLRIVAIGTYLRKSKRAVGGAVKDYESFLHEVRKRRRADPFILELLALHGSTFVFSLFVVVAGWRLTFERPSDAYVYLISGGVGILTTLGLVATFGSRIERINRVDVRRAGDQEDARRTTPLETAT
jgi:hypothetical protein